MPDGTVRLTGASPVTRIGLTSAWYFAGSTNVACTFADGLPARVGDFLMSTNGFDLGAIYTVTKVYPTGNVDIQYNQIRFQTFQDTGWKEIGAAGNPPLTNGWVWHSGFAKPAYRVMNGIVYLKGVIDGVTGGTSAFTLPVGARPLETHIFSAAASTVPTNAASAGTAHTHTISSANSRVDVLPNGNVQPSIVGVSYNSISGICFPAEQ